MADLAAFALAAAPLLILPGPTNALLATAGARGARKALALLPAVLAAYATTVGAVALLVGAGGGASPIAGAAIRMTAAACLVWLGVRIWRRAGTGPIGGDRSVRRREIYLVTLVNPKAFILALLLPLDGRLAGHATVLAAAIAASGLAWLLAGHALARSAPRMVAGGLVERVGAAVIVAFAAYFGATAFAALVPR